MHCAALAYYSIFSLAPLIVIAIALVGFFFGEQAGRGEIFNTIHSLMGDSGAKTVQSIVLSVSKNPHTGLIATIAGLVPLILGATGVFQQLQDSFNQIWKVHPQPGNGLKIFIKQRLLSFALIVGIGFFLILSVVFSAALSIAGKFVTHSLPGGEFLWHATAFLLSFAIVTVLFATLFKVLPDMKVPWKSVWPGAVVTALLFDVGRAVIGLYLGKSGATSAYGAAGSVIAILLWVYYSSAIMLFGAELTRLYFRCDEKVLEPKKGAERTRRTRPAQAA